MELQGNILLSTSLFVMWFHLTTARKTRNGIWNAEKPTHYGYLLPIISNALHLKLYSLSTSLYIQKWFRTPKSFCGLYLFYNNYDNTFYLPNHLKGLEVPPAVCWPYFDSSQTEITIWVLYSVCYYFMLYILYSNLFVEACNFGYFWFNILILVYKLYLLIILWFKTAPNLYISTIILITPLWLSATLD